VSRRRGLAVHGVLPVDKPSGPTSYDLVAAVRRHTGAARVGHAGTLDPLASGLLLVCLGEGTKAVPWLMDAPKRYEAELLLGVETDTLDAQGRVTREAPLPPLDRGAVEVVLAGFGGTIAQVPPAYSALKQGGECLYEKARRGEDVAVEARAVVVHELALVAFEPPRLSLRVVCGKGFYVRSLARDVGAALGCGAHLTALRRTATAGFDVSAARTPDTLLAGDAWQDALVPVEAALAHLPPLPLDAEGARRAGHGMPVAWPAAAGGAPDGPVRMLAPDGALVAVGEAFAGPDGDALIRVLRGFLGPQTGASAATHGGPRDGLAGAPTVDKGTIDG
jgi:tRNA pseudouridine55 synthase